MALPITRRAIVKARITCNVVKRIGLLNVSPAFANDDGELALKIKPRGRCWTR